MPGLNESPVYRKFIQERDKALEKILANSHARITDYSRAAFREIESECALLCHRHEARSFPQSTRVLVHQLSDRIAHSFYYLGILIHRELTALMRRSYVLASVGEAEAIARATGDGKYHVEGTKAKTVNQERIQYNLNTTRYKILKAFEHGLVLEESTNEIMERVRKAFPIVNQYKKPPRILKSLKESDRDPLKDAAQGFVTDEDWQDVVHDYLTDYVPQYSKRGDYVVDVKQDSGEYEERYGWEIEKETNHAFVDQVRAGQNEIANQNGYTDMVWISILDDRTDDCCEWRNGLTSSEIEAKLEDEHSDDDCDAIVPPAHFNCATAGHRILTPYGEKKIEEIKPGDTVISHLGIEREVKKTLQSMSKSLVRITLSNGEKLTVTEDHPFLIGGEWKPVKDLSVGDYLSLFGPLK